MTIEASVLIVTIAASVLFVILPLLRSIDAKLTRLIEIAKHGPSVEAD